MKPAMISILGVFFFFLPLRAQDPIPLVTIPDNPCVHTDRGQDRLVFPASHAAFDSLYQVLDTLLLEHCGRLNILHIGGSHVQAGYFSHRMRTNLTSLSDSIAGDRGLLFPFRAIRTNAPTNYVMSCNGTWQGVRCIQQDSVVPLGLSGASAVTHDSLASVTFDAHSLGSWSPRFLRVLGESSSPQVYPLLLCGGDTITPALSDGKPGWLFPVPKRDSLCTIAFNGLHGDNHTFALRGVWPMTGQSGITYSESGVNGATVSAWLRCECLPYELSLLQPHLVIFGIGINDANVAPRNFDSEVFKANYRQLIQRVKDVSPTCCFLFVTNNDCWFNVRGLRRRPNTNTMKVQQAMKELAQEFDGAVFDVFSLMGGQGSSNAWVRRGLQRRDHIHFTQAGYELLGDLLFNALMRDYQVYRDRRK